jgi:hypothetical protein
MGGEYDKFVYHVHQSELSAFLADKPKKAAGFRPDVWWLGPRVALVDALGEGRAQVLVAGEENPQQYLLDLDGDTDITLPPMDLVVKRAFDAEAALHVYPNIGFDSFFDRDNDGTMDVVYSVRQVPRASAVVHLRGQDGTWTARVVASADEALDGGQLGDAKAVGKFKKLLQVIGAGANKK